MPAVPNPLQDPQFMLHRLIQALMHRQDLYALRERYATGDHPLPKGDPRYQKALAEIQNKAKTNYVGLAIKATTDRMKVRGMKFLGELDEDAMRIWRSNNMDVQAQIAVGLCAELSDIYAMVSPPNEDDPNSEPQITIEDPRTCIIEPDPMDPMGAVAGLKFYEDTIREITVAVLLFPDVVYIFEGPAREDFLARWQDISPANIVSGVAFTLVDTIPNPIGKVPLVRGSWIPRYGLRGMAECEDGGWDIQNRINTTVLLRMVIGNSQAFRQRWMIGAQVPKGKDGVVKQTPFEPAADLVWAVASPDAKFGDFEQADITQLLEAIRDDVGDFSAITQTPVTYLTNKMVNVSAEAMMAAQVSLISKIRNRSESLGWFFEQVMKLCFLYKGDTERATDVEAETLWENPETKTLMELADWIAKASSAGLSLRLILETTGLYTNDEIDLAVEEHEKMQEQQLAQQVELAEKTAAAKPAPAAGAKPAAKSAAKPAAKKPAAKPTAKKK